jgi:hypothetical protein
MQFTDVENVDYYSLQTYLNIHNKNTFNGSVSKEELEGLVLSIILSLDDESILKNELLSLLPKELYDVYDDLVSLLLDSTSSKLTVDLLNQLIELCQENSNTISFLKQNFIIIDYDDINKKYRYLSNNMYNSLTSKSNIIPRILLDNNASNIIILTENESNNNNINISKIINTNILYNIHNIGKSLVKNIKFGINEWTLYIQDNNEINNNICINNTNQNIDPNTNSYIYKPINKFLAISPVYVFNKMIEVFTDQFYWGWGYNSYNNNNKSIINSTKTSIDEVGNQWTEELENVLLELLVLVNDEFMSILRGFETNNNNNNNIMNSMSSELIQLSDMLLHDISEVLQTHSNYYLGLYIYV